MQGRALASLILGTWLAAGCDGEATLDGALVVGTIDAARLCDVNAIDLRIRARWRSCPKAEPDCPMPAETSLDGDRFSCPVTDPTLELGVELPEAGSYRIEVVSMNSGAPPESECFVAPGGGGGRVELTTAQVEQSAVVRLRQHGACPPEG